MDKDQVTPNPFKEDHLADSQAQPDDQATVIKEGKKVDDDLDGDKDKDIDKAYLEETFSPEKKDDETNDVYKSRVNFDDDE